MSRRSFIELGAGAGLCFVGICTSTDWMCAFGLAWTWAYFRGWTRAFDDD